CSADARAIAAAEPLPAAGSAVGAVEAASAGPPAGTVIWAGGGAAILNPGSGTGPWIIGRRSTAPRWAQATSRAALGCGLPWGSPGGPPQRPRTGSWHSIGPVHL